MGNKASRPVDEQVQHNPKYQINFCPGICNAASEKSECEKVDPILFSQMDEDEKDIDVPKGDEAPLSCKDEQREDETHENLKQKIKENQLVVVGYAPDHREIETMSEYTPIEVKFSVIKLCIKDTIAKYLSQVDKNFEKEHSKPEAKSWRLSSKGYYYKIIKENKIVLVSDNDIYQGSVVSNTFLPHKEGQYISSRGVYTGSFKNGAAHGVGKFVGEKFRYTGNWVDGVITEGSLETRNFIFKGQFEDKIPCRGKITMKKTNTKYEGKLKNGMFQDNNATYECDEYIYQGGFRQGCRHGYGQLKEKTIVRNRAPRKVKGQWNRDSLLHRESKQLF